MLDNFIKQNHYTFHCSILQDGQSIQKIDMNFTKVKAISDQQAGNAYHAHIPVGNLVNNLAPIEWLQTKHWFQGTQYLIEFPAYQHA